MQFKVPVAQFRGKLAHRNWRVTGNDSQRDGLIDFQRSFSWCVAPLPSSVS